MAKRLLKIVTALVLSVCVMSSLLLCVACSDNNGGESNVTSSSPDSASSGSGSGGSGGGSGGSESNPSDKDETEPKAVVREGLSVNKIMGDLMAMSFSDCVDMLTGKGSSIFEGYMVGDLVNFALKNTDLNIAGATPEGLGFKLYDNGKWYATYNNKEVDRILNAFLNYKLDRSEPLGLTDADIKNFGSATLLKLTGLDDDVISGIFEIMPVNPIVYNFLNARIDALANLTSNDGEVVFNSLKTIIGESTLSEAAELFSVTPSEEYADITFNDIFDEYGALFTCETEEELSAAVMAIAMGKLSGYIAEHGEDVVFNGVTVNDIYNAVMDPQNEQSAATVKAVAQYLYEKADLNYDVDAIVDAIDSYLEAYKDVTVYDEYTLSQLIEMAKSADGADDIIAAITAEIEKIKEDSEYAQKVFAPIAEIYAKAIDDIDKKYGDIDVTEDITLSEAITILSDTENEDYEETINALCEYAIPYLYGYIQGSGIDTLFTEYYPQVKNLVVYKEYTVEDIVNGASDIEPAQAFAVVMAEAINLVNDEELRVETALLLLQSAAQLIAPYSEEKIISEPIEYTVGMLSLDVMMTVYSEDQFMPTLTNLLKDVTLGDILAAQ